MLGSLTGVEENLIGFRSHGGETAHTGALTIPKGKEMFWNLGAVGGFLQPGGRPHCV